MDMPQELETLRSNSSRSSDDDDFMQDWPHAVNTIQDIRRSWVLLLTLCFFFGPFFSPFTFLCLCCNYHVKAKHMWYDRFVLLMGTYMVVQMIVTGAFAIYIPIMDVKCDEENDSQACETYNSHSWADRYAIFVVYIILFSWMASAAVRHFLSLSADGYDQLPEKLQRLRGIEFEPAVVQPEGALPCTDVPTLVQKLCAFSDIFQSDIALHNRDNEWIETASDVYTNLDTASFQSDSTEISDCPADETVNNPNWKYPLFAGCLLSIAELFLNRFLFSEKDMLDWLTEFDTMMPFTTASLLVMTGLTNSVSLALFMLYYKQLSGLRKFAQMTNFFEQTSSATRVLIDIRSTRNFILWYEARTHLVDQISAPTSFLRTIFDPTCAVMLLTIIGGGFYIMLNHFFSHKKFDQLSFLVTWHTIYAMIFFYIVASFTRKIQRELQAQEALLVRQKINVFDEFKSRCASNWDIAPVTPQEITIAEGEVIKIFGSTFCYEEFKKDLGEGRKRWRWTLMKLNAWRKRGEKSPQELDRIEALLSKLEQRFFEDEITRSSWRSYGVCKYEGPQYLVPECGTEGNVPPLHAHLNTSEDIHRKKNEIYRRMRTIESVLIHTRNRSISPNILGIPLSGYLFVIMLILLSIRIPLMSRLIIYG